MSKRRPTQTQPESTTNANSLFVSSLTIQSDRQAEQPFYNLPTSPASELYMSVLTAGENVSDLKRSNSHGGKYSIIENPKNPDNVAATYEKGGTKITVELENVSRLVGSNKAAKKMFVYSLIKLNEQAVHGGEMSRPTIGFSLEELIDRGMYKTQQSARRGVKDAFAALSSLKIRGEITGKGKKTDTQTELAVLFPYYSIRNNYVTVDLNPRINWAIMTQYYTLLPKYVLALPNKAFDLAYYIFYLARQNTKEIREKGSFNISFRAIHSRLQLPDERGLNNPQRDIKQPIEDAVEAIENASQTTEFTITPVYDERASIKEYLDKGYLEIGLKGEYAQTFIALAETRSQQIEHAQQRKEKIEDTAKAKALEKHIEAAQKAE